MRSMNWGNVKILDTEQSQSQLFKRRISEIIYKKPNK